MRRRFRPVAATPPLHQRRACALLTSCDPKMPVGASLLRTKVNLFGRRGPAAPPPSSLFPLIERARVPRHFEATDEIGIAGRARRFGADAIAFFGRQERRPFVDEFLPNGL